MRAKPRRAPKGGCTCNGRWYRGGQFLPAAGRIELPHLAASPPASRGDRPSPRTSRAPGRASTPKRSTPHAPPSTGHAPRSTPDLVAELAELAIQHVLAVEFAPDPAAARAIRRTHRGTATPGDARILDARRRAAIAMLADAAPDPLRPYWRGRLAAYRNG